MKRHVEFEDAVKPASNPSAHVPWHGTCATYQEMKDLLVGPLKEVLKAAREPWKPIPWDVGRILFTFKSTCDMLTKTEADPVGGYRCRKQAYELASAVQGNIVKYWRDCTPKWTSGQKAQPKFSPFRDHFRKPTGDELMSTDVNDDMIRFLKDRALDRFLSEPRPTFDDKYGWHLVALYTGSGIQGDEVFEPETHRPLSDMLGECMDKPTHGSPDYVLHGTWVYSLGCICATGELLVSDDSDNKGHEFQEPGAYATTNRRVAISYSRPFVPNSMQNDTWQVVLVLKVVKRHSCWLSGQQGQYVYQPNSLRLSRMLFVPNRPDLWERSGTHVVTDYMPMLEASPFRLASLTARTVEQGLTEEMQMKINGVVARMKVNEDEKTKALMWTWAFVAMQQLLVMNKSGQYDGEAGCFASKLIDCIPEQFQYAVQHVSLQAQNGCPEAKWIPIITCIPRTDWTDDNRGVFGGVSLDLRDHGNIIRALFSKIVFQGCTHCHHNGESSGDAHDGDMHAGPSRTPCMTLDDMAVYINYACEELEYSSRAEVNRGPDGVETSIRFTASADSMIQRHGKKYKHHARKEYAMYQKQKMAKQRDRANVSTEVGELL